LPEARISSRSILLRNCLTLPGHSWTWSVAMASSLRIRLGSPCAALMRSMKYCTNSAISPRRSLKPGTRTGTTFRR